MVRGNQPMKFVSLFSGIGGIDLGLERAGMECVGQVENDPWCTKILEKHWPTIPRWQDIHDLDPKELPDHDLIAGGFPCQPVSLAGARLAQDDPRWLWPEFFRIVRVVRPRYVVVENVPGLLTAGFGDLADDLAGIGYDFEWTHLAACAIGAPHSRNRLFLVAYSDCIDGRQERPVFVSNDYRRAANDVRSGSVYQGADLFGNSRWQGSKPEPVGVADGVSRRVDRLKGLGNAVVPQVAELVGRMIMDTV